MKSKKILGWSNFCIFTTKISFSLEKSCFLPALKKNNEEVHMCENEWIALNSEMQTQSNAISERNLKVGGTYRRQM